MAHMRPVVDHFAAYHVDTECGTEIVPESLCGRLGNGETLTPFEIVGNMHALEPYLEGSRIHGVERHEGWYARLSAPGYLDCTSWDGPHASKGEALCAVKNQYEVDDGGEPLEDMAPSGLDNDGAIGLDDE